MLSVCWPVVIHALHFARDVLPPQLFSTTNYHWIVQGVQKVHIWVSSHFGKSIISPIEMNLVK